MNPNVSAGVGRQHRAQLRSFSAWAELTYKHRSEAVYSLIFQWEEGEKRSESPQPRGLHNSMPTVKDLVSYCVENLPIDSRGSYG